jgi:hypothetical protein
MLPLMLAAAPTRRKQEAGGVRPSGRRQRDCDPGRDLVLQAEQIARVTVEALGPQMRVGLGIDQLGVDADLVARSPDVASQHIADAQIATDLLCVNLLALVGERGIARSPTCPRSEIDRSSDPR